MSDLISREELIRVIDHRLTHTKDARKSHKSVFVDGMEDGYARIRSDVLLMPSAERRGHWIFSPSDAIELMFTKPKCSECGFESADGGNYCSNCGADMRGEEE